MAAEIDPRVFYCFVLAEDDPYETSPFQGFSRGWMTLSWAMLRLVELPADVLEAALPHQAVLARRMGGTGGWHWFPLALSALDQLAIERTAPFWVCFSGTQAVARAVSAWADKQVVRPLHVTAGPCEKAITGEVLDPTILRQHLEATLRDVRRQDASLESGLIDQALAEWRERPRVDMTFPKREHNCTLPNHMALEAAGGCFEKAEPLIGRTMQDYVAAIRQTVDAVRELRRDVGHVPGFRLTPPLPALILTAPALYRHAYLSMRPVSYEEAADPQIVNKVMRFLQRQKTFNLTLEKEEVDRLLTSEEAKGIVWTRQQELVVHTLAVGLRGASTLAATIRVPPAVNRTAGVVRQLAAHARSVEIARPHKFSRLFSIVQAALGDAVGSDLIDQIARTEGDIKLVTDAPLEWLPIGPLPLGLKFDCSRITATPGNLMAGELALPSLLRLKTSAFSDILLVSAFGADDPIRNMVPAALQVASPMWRDKLTIRFVAVANEAAFCDALNTYDGAILIFDGHGRHAEGTGIGTLAVGDDNVDIWSLRGRVRVPPIVILSACDTQAADRSHATTANAFLAAGARAVLGTLLPIDARRAAVFLARLLYRIVDFLPTAIEARAAAVQWSEVVGGLLRMQLLTDLLRPYLADGRLARPDYEHIHSKGNMEINKRHADWFDVVAELTAQRLSSPLDQVHNEFRDRIVLSDTIRYIQLGNPETILIDDPATAERVEADLLAREVSL